MTRFRRDEVVHALPLPTQPLVLSILEAAERGSDGGWRVYLVGGPVRDLLLDLPVRDVDLLLEPPPGVQAEVEALAREAAPDGARVVAHGRFHTVTLATPDAAVDLACARREIYAHPGALPTVEPGTLEEDLQRRDFSVNTFALRLAPDGEGAQRLCSVDGARGDLEARRLRVLHARSFHDDPTRALRAARLSARLGFHLTRPSRTALRDALRDGAFGRVSGERLRREVEKLFEDATRGVDPSQALRRLEGWHVLGALEPGLVLPRESLTSLRRLGRSLASPPWPLQRLRPWASGLSLWLAPLAPALRRRTLGRLAVRGEGASRIADFPRRRRGWLRQLEKARGRGSVDAVLSELDETELLALHASAPPLLRRRIVRYAAEDRARRLPVTGADLVSAGLRGPAVGRALARVRAAWLDGEVANREEALALARELARRRAARGGRGSSG